jgi:hypothetical protein
MRLSAKRQVPSGAFKAFSQGAVFHGELLEAALERDVL